MGPDDPIFQRSAPPAVARPLAASKRSFKAGVTDRLTSSWTVQDQTVNQSLLRFLRPMRARSRDFFRNNEYGRKFGALVKTNVVGHAGFALKFDCRREDGSPDRLDSDVLLRAWKRFARRGQYEVTGRLSEALFDALALTMIARDGEVLVRLVAGADRGVHHFQLQLLPGHLLDEEMNRDLGGGARIRMGVEFDAFMKPQAYHLRLQPKTADMHGATSQRYERVPADEILHLFVPEEVDQWRGVPWPFVGLRAARMLEQFDEAALVAANVGAAKMGFFQQQKDAEGAPTSSTETDGDDFITEAAPGSFDIIPEGYELTEWSPDYPNAVYDPFTKAVLRRISTGLLTSYHTLSGDLTDVNFSSIRSGTLDERELWKMLQGWYVSAAKEAIVEKWLARALLFDAELKRLPYAKFEKFNSPVFTGRRWDWVDPQKDVNAATAAVALGIKSRAQVIRDQGNDPEQVWAELEHEQSLGLTVPTPGSANTQSNKEGGQ
jgi:lambda family phage portal protein